MSTRKTHKKKRNGWFAQLREHTLNDKEDGDNLPDLIASEILAWADAHHARSGRWPTCHSGSIPEANGETWLAVEAALCLGVRGFGKGSTLARFLAEHRGKYNRRAPPQLSVEQILAWADDFHRRRGNWPIQSSGPIPGAPELKWHIIAKALRIGRCGLPGGTSLARLLADMRGVPNRLDLPDLSEEQILSWADDYRRRTGDWPRVESGPIHATASETWTSVDMALRKGSRGLSAGLSLPRLLAARRGARNKQDRPILNEAKVLAWADAHYARTGAWPTCHSESIADAPGETWTAVDAALRQGGRGFPGGGSLTRLLGHHRGLRNRNHPPTFQIPAILSWADAWYTRTGKWPTVHAGPIPEAPGETWQAVHDALYHGQRGLPGGSSLARLLAHERGVRNIHGLPPLTTHQILQWAMAHSRRNSAWPTRCSGPIPEAPGETWDGVFQALYKGLRGLPAKRTRPWLSEPPPG